MKAILFLYLPFLQAQDAQSSLLVYNCSHVLIPRKMRY